MNESSDQSSPSSTSAAATSLDQPPSRRPTRRSPVARLVSPTVSIDITWTPAARRALAQTQSVRAWNAALRRAVRAVCDKVPPLSSASTCEWNFSVAWVDDAQMQQMNAQFRGKNRPTDVLSFSQQEGNQEGDWLAPDAGEENAPHLWGDIVIAVETAQRQAHERQHEATTEILFLAIHGTLHLFGYAHLRDAQRRAMWKWQDEVFESLRPPSAVVSTI